MNYFEMTTEKLETLKSCLEEQINNYVGMPFPSLRSDLVTYEIDSIDPDEVLITVNHYFNGLIRDYTVSINGGVDDDVEYNRYNADEEIVDGGYMSFDRLPKIIRNAVLEIYALYKEFETINNILDTRAEEEPEEVADHDFRFIADVLGFDGFDYDDAKTKLENDSSILDARSEEEEEEKKLTTPKNYAKIQAFDKQQDTKGIHTMKRFDAYNAYNVNRDFRYIANALGFTGFKYDHFDDYFKAKLENDEDLGDLLEQLEDIEYSQFLIYTCTKIKFYERHECDILSYLKTYGYDDNDSLQSIENIMCSRVIAYVTGVLSEYGY